MKLALDQCHPRDRHGQMLEPMGGLERGSVPSRYQLGRSSSTDSVDHRMNDLLRGLAIEEDNDYNIFDSIGLWFSICTA